MSEVPRDGIDPAGIYLGTKTASSSSARRSAERGLSCRTRSLGSPRSKSWP